MSLVVMEATFLTLLSPDVIPLGFLAGCFLSFPLGVLCGACAMMLWHGRQVRLSEKRISQARGPGAVAPPAPPSAGPASLAPQGTPDRVQSALRAPRSAVELRPPRGCCVFVSPLGVRWHTSETCEGLQRARRKFDPSPCAGIVPSAACEEGASGNPPVHDRMNAACTSWWVGGGAGGGMGGRAAGEEGAHGWGQAGTWEFQSLFGPSLRVQSKSTATDDSGSMRDLSGFDGRAQYLLWRETVRGQEAKVLARNPFGTYRLTSSQLGRRDGIDTWERLFHARVMTAAEHDGRRRYPGILPVVSSDFWEFELRCDFIGCNLAQGAHLRMQNEKLRNLQWP